MSDHDDSCPPAPPPVRPRNLPIGTALANLEVEVNTALAQFRRQVWDATEPLPPGELDDLLDFLRIGVRHVFEDAAGRIEALARNYGTQPPR